MSDYTRLYQRALELVTRKGTSVTFTLGNESITGSAVQDEGGFRDYMAQGLISEQDQVVVFVPDTQGDCPEEGYTLSGFTDVDFVTKKVFPIQPNGTVIAARVIVSR